ncbi:YjiK family protein [Rhodobacter sp.]
MRRWLLLGIGALIVAGIGLWSTGMIGLAQARVAMQGQRAEWRDKGLWLPDYTATIQAQPIRGLSQNVSGLTFSAATGTLFTVINRPPLVAEISPDGRLLRRVPLTGAQDPEGITHMEGDRFIISDEGLNRLSRVTITPRTTALDITDAPHLTLDLDVQDNMGFEGISWDAATRRLILVQEMWPVRVLTVTGLDAALAGGPLALGVQEWTPAAGHAFLAADLSSVTLHETTGNLLLLSHLNAALFEYSTKGEIVSVLPLWSGWAALQDDIPQAEGVAIGNAAEVFLVSEPNLFYRLERQAPAGRVGKDG